MDIQNTGTAYATRGTDPVGSIAPAVPLPAAPARDPLGPAATVDLSEEGRVAVERPAAEASAPVPDQPARRLSVDPDTRQIVFQVYDPASNTVLDQLPDESTLRARAYAREMTAQNASANQTVDRTA